MHWPFVSLRTVRHTLALWPALLLIPVVALAQSPSGSSFVGVWQGSLPVEQSPRIVVKIRSTDGVILRGVFTWIDRDSDAIAFSSLSVIGQQVKATSDLLNVKYRGKLTGDGKSLTGTWTQNKTDYALILTKVTSESEWKHNDALSLRPMLPNADPAFEVATIKL